MFRNIQSMRPKPLEEFWVPFEISRYNLGDISLQVTVQQSNSLLSGTRVQARAAS